MLHDLDVKPARLAAMFRRGVDFFLAILQTRDSCWFLNSRRFMVLKLDALARSPACVRH